MPRPRKSRACESGIGKIPGRFPFTPALVDSGRGESNPWCELAGMGRGGADMIRGLIILCVVAGLLVFLTNTVATILAGMALLAAAFGLHRREKWGASLALVAAILGAIFNLISLLMSLTMILTPAHTIRHVLLFTGSLFWLGLAGVIIYLAIRCQGELR